MASLQLLAELAIPHNLRYETKYGFEDVLTVLDVGSSLFIAWLYR